MSRGCVKVEISSDSWPESFLERHFVDSLVVHGEEYERLRQRPEGTAAMLQSWRDLTFLHFSIPPQDMQRLLPRGLTVDTFPNQEGEEMAWVGLVPFRMEGIRPTWGPALPWISAFPETNVRTYVHREGKGPGVWFFSLDAARWLACSYARARFHLPYYHARMAAERLEDRITYHSRRRRSPNAHINLYAQVGARLVQPEFGAFEFFAVERYVLYSTPYGRLHSGRVWHKPYPLRCVEKIDCNESLVEAAGIEPKPWQHQCYSEGVDVEVFSLEPIG